METSSKASRDEERGEVERENRAFSSADCIMQFMSDRVVSAEVEYRGWDWLHQ